MKRVGVVALNTFREAVRDRVLYNLLFFALVMMAASIIAGQISIGIEETVIATLGLSAISLIGLLIAIFIGVGLVSKEMDKRTLYALLAKPVRRWEFLLGKFGGLRQAHARARRRDRFRGGVFHLAEVGAGSGAGLAFFLLHNAPAGHSVYRRHLHCWVIRAGVAGFAGCRNESGNDRIHEMAFLPAAEF
jgi:ABC-2 family transporter protein